MKKCKFLFLYVVPNEIILINSGFPYSESDLTLFYYARVALKKLRTCFQVRNLKIVMAKPDSQKTLLEGAKLISKWFHFWDQFSYDKLVEVEPLILVDILDYYPTNGSESWAVSRGKQQFSPSRNFEMHQQSFF